MLMFMSRRLRNSTCRIRLRRWFFLALILLAACSKPAAKTPQDDGLFPFKTGAQWAYFLETITPGGGRVAAQIYTNVDGTEVLDDKTYVHITTKSYSALGEETHSALYRQTPDGVFKIDGDHREHGEFMETPRPLEVGEEWTVHDPRCDLQCRVESIESVTLPSGTFDKCWKIVMKGSKSAQDIEVNLSITTYRAPGIGDVKTSTTFASS